jgi:hypothetical protein
MAKLVWDKVGEKLWETGVDRTVLFPMNTNGGYAAGVAWSGITAINESPSGAEPTKIYADNIVYGVVMSPEEDALTIEAFTYPDEYAECIGEASVGTGAVIKQQAHKHFGLAYRTMVGNDTLGTEHGYKLHIFWDCVSGASEDSNSTINDSPEQKTFSWSVTTLPVATDEGFQPTASMVIDSTKVPKAKLDQIEDLLYGTAQAESSLPTFAALKTILTAA